jgi:hypothetical protein
MRRLSRAAIIGQSSPTAAPINIVEMTQPLISIWRGYVQVWIDSQYVPWQTGADLDSVRADIGWNWFQIYSLAYLHNVMRKLPGNQSGAAIAWCIVIVDESGREFPIGMLTVVPKFHCNVGGEVRERVFTWYLSDAPSEVYERVLQIDPIRGVARALIDTAIQSGFDMGADGTLLLRADPKGGPKLVNFYSGKCNMTQLSSTNPPVSTARRQYSGQYFLMDSVTAIAFCKKNDIHR